MTLIATTVDTPLGQMALLGTADCLHVAAFGDDLDELRDRLPTSLREERMARGETAAAAALRDYFAGDVRALDRVDVRQPGGPFHTAVWREMRAIPPGTTLSYGELAARAGAPRAVRAAGSACARNAVCLFVPCHRVVRSDGGLGGYYYGLGTKLSLLEHERCH
jgi:methylated-DNA-[protein]-cysteine S-methyltransferase